MDIHEIALEFGVSLYKLRRMERAGVLVTTPTNEATGKIRALLSKNQRLSALDLVGLLLEPAILDQLPPKYRTKAKAQLAALGDVPGGSMGPGAATWVVGAAILDPAALNEFVTQLKERIPPGGCDHSFLACRILWGVPGKRLKEINRYLRVALMNAKRHPGFAGWFEVRDGKTFFKNPGPEPLDL